MTHAVLVSSCELLVTESLDKLIAEPVELEADVADVEDEMVLDAVLVAD